MLFVVVIYLSLSLSFYLSIIGPPYCNPRNGYIIVIIGLDLCNYSYKVSLYFAPIFQGYNTNICIIYMLSLSPRTLHLNT